jgi:F1F0 ATPase subunit 2
MATFPSLLSAGLLGIILGFLFFYGLWMSAHKILSSGQPVRWLVGSLLVRMMLVLGGFYWVADGNWQRLLACLLGFTLGRFVIYAIVKKSRLGMPTVAKAKSGAKHAS